MPVLPYLRVALGAFVGAYVLGVLCACLLSDRLIFLPPPASYPDSPEIFKITTPDGVKLAARHLPCPSARYTLIFFHGNAEDLGGIEPFLHLLRDRLGIAVLAWDYRGYGRSGGRVGEPATLRDAHTIFAYVTDALGVPTDRIILYGRSLGGGPAVELAASERCAMLVLQSAFTSTFRVMTRVRLLPFDKFNNLARMPRVRCPVLVIHGTADRVVPFYHGQQLYAAASGPKRHLWVEGAGHNDLVEAAGETYWQALREFLPR